MKDERKGPPSSPKPDPDNLPALGVDLGGTNTKIGLVDHQGQVRQRLRLPTRPEEGPRQVAGRICQAARECLAAAGLGPEQVSGAGIGCPGTIDLEDGIVAFAPNLPGWRDVPLRSLIADELGRPCSLDNDANVAALAEHWVGAGRGASSLVLLTLGTGIGGGIILDGRIWHGATGAAGEIGHMSINPDGPRCQCGNRGCYEVYGSATAMVRRLREAARQGAQTTLSSRLEELTAEDIYKAAVEGDTLALQNLEDTGRYLGVGVSNILHILNPEVIVFSGGPTAAGDMLLQPIREEVRSRTLQACYEGVRICFSRLSDDAGVIGAARRFMVTARG